MSLNVSAANKQSLLKNRIAYDCVIRRRNNNVDHVDLDALMPLLMTIDLIIDFIHTLLEGMICFYCVL